MKNLSVGSWVHEAHYKKKYLNIDERALTEYFPLEQTVKSLLSISVNIFITYL